MTNLINLFHKIENDILLSQVNAGEDDTITIYLSNASYDRLNDELSQIQRVTIANYTVPYFPEIRFGRCLYIRRKSDLQLEDLIRSEIQQLLVRHFSIFHKVMLKSLEDRTVWSRIKRLFKKLFTREK